MLKEILHAGNCLKQCFPNLFASGPLLALKINHGSSHPCARQHTVRVTVSKIRYLYLAVTSSICSNVLHHVTLITLTNDQ